MAVKWILLNSIKAYPLDGHCGIAREQFGAALVDLLTSKNSKRIAADTHTLIMDEHVLLNDA